MDKKLLVSLMMTAPVAAFGAQANWVTSSGSGLLSYSILPEVSEGNWTAKALADFSTNEGRLVCPVAAGSLAHNTFLPTGKYAFKCNGLVNALIKVNGKYLVKTNDKNEYVDKDGKVIKDTELVKMVPLLSVEVTYKAETSVSIEVVPVAKDKQFEVGEMSYTLDFNFATVKSSLQADLNTASQFEIVADSNDRAEAKALRERKDALSVKAAEIQNCIDLIDLAKGESLHYAYTKFALDKWATENPGDRISEEIATLAGDSKTYNDEVVAENKIWDNTQTNKTALQTLNNEVKELQKQLNAKKAEVDDIVANNPAPDKQLADYCKFATSSDIEAAQAEIDKYQADINAAYADLTKTVSFTSKKDAIAGHISAISYDTAKADWSAYDTFLQGIKTVESEYGKLFAQINNIEVKYTKLSDKSEVANVYEDVIGNANVEITKIYKNNAGYAINDEGGLTPDNMNIAGAAANLATAQDQINARKAEMDEVYTNLYNLKENQEKQIGEAKAQIAKEENGYKDLCFILNNPAFVGLSEADQKIVKDDLALIENAINELKSIVDVLYLVHNLDVNDTPFTNQDIKVDDAIKKFKDDTASFSAVIELAVGLSDAKKYAIDKTSATGISEYNLASKFDETFANIEDAIDNFYKNPTDAAKADIEKSIQDSKTMCDQLVGSFSQAVSALTDAQKALDSFNKAIDKKVVVTINGKFAYVKDSYKYTYNTDKSLTAASVATAIAAYEKELSDIASGDARYANPNDAYKAANSVSAKIDSDNYATLVNTAQIDFENTVSKANLAAVTKVADDIDVKKNTDPYKNAVGMDKVGVVLSLPEDYEGSNNAAEATSAVNSAFGNATALAKCDSDLVVLAAAYDKVYDQIKKVVDNYDTWKLLLGNESVAQTVLDTAIAGIGIKTVEPAGSFYKGEFVKLQIELDNILKAINASYNAINEVADKNGHVASIDAFKQKVKDLENAMIANHNSYVVQIGAAKALANDAYRLIDWLDANDEVQTSHDKYIAEVKIVTDELAAVNVELTKSFSKGESAKNDDTYQEKFNNLRNKLQAIYDAETDGYKSAVEKANDAYLAAQGIVPGSLDKQYDKAIDWVNEYRYDISNPGYYDALVEDLTFKQNHNALQDCYKEINDLEGDIASFVSGLTSGTDRDKWVVLEDNDVTSNEIILSDIINESQTVSVKIATTLADVDKAAKKVADDYCLKQNGDAQAKYDGIKTRLSDAGLSADATDDKGKTIDGEVTKAVSSLTLKLSSAQKADKTYVDAIGAAIVGTEKYKNAVHAYVLGMSGICDNLDVVNAVKPDNFVKVAINSQWTANYNAAVVAIQGYISTARTYTLASAAYLETINGCLDKVNDLDEEWDGLKIAAQREEKFGLFDNSNTSHDNLEDLVALAANKCASAKAEHDKIVADNDAYKVLITDEDSYLNKTQAALDALLAWSGYRENQLSTIDGIQNYIDGEEVDVKSDSNVSINLESHKTHFTNLLQVIENTYNTVFSQEKTFANELMLLTRSAFNNAKTADTDTAVLDKYDKEIKDITDALGALTYDKDDKTGCREKLFALENKLCAAIDALEELGRTGSVDTDSYEETLGQLNAQYNALNVLLSKLQSDIESEGAKSGSYGEAVVSEFGPKAKVLTTKLEGYKAEYDAVGVVLISGSDEYAFMMTELESEYEELFKAWEPKQTEALKKFTSDTCYEILVKEIDTLEAQTKFAYDEAMKYGSVLYEQSYENISIRINGQKADPEQGISAYVGVREALANDKKAYSITKDTELSDYDNNVEDEVTLYVRSVLKKAADMHVSNEKDHASDAINSIESPGINEKGWTISFHDADSILKSLDAENKKIKAIDTTTIRIVPDPYDSNKQIAIASEEAIETYNDITENLETICAEIDKILSSAKEEMYVKGDVDEDGDINVIDVQKLINLVGEGYDAEGKEKETLDVNADGDINVADVTSLINTLTGNTNNGTNTRMAVRRFMPAMSGDNAFRVEEVVGENGMRRFAVVLSNEVAFAAGQLDIVLPDYAKVADVSLGERANGLEAYTFEKFGSTRIVMTSLDNSMISGNNGCMLFIDVEGNAELEVENVIFSDINGNAYTLVGNGTTGVDVIYDSIKNGVKAIYNAAGQKLKGMTKGVNIIRNADGTVSKKIGK